MASLLSTSSSGSDVICPFVDTRITVQNWAVHFGVYLVVTKNLLELLLGNAHPDAVGAVHHKYNGMDITVEYGRKANRAFDEKSRNICSIVFASVVDG